jgi:hypothetical protein
MKKIGIKVNIFEQRTLDYMVSNREYKLRVFVKGCQNLSAVDNNVNDYRNQLAGDKALSSADPYLVMKIVGQQDDFFNGREKA